MLESPAAEPEASWLHFASKLNVETDAWDVKTDMERGWSDFIVIDTRSNEAFEARPVAGAINSPHRGMNRESTMHIESFGSEGPG